MPTIATINGIAEDNIATYNGATASTVTGVLGNTWAHWGPPETIGTKVIFEDGEIGFVRVAGLSDTKAVVAYKDKDNSNYGTACVLDISNNIITPGTPMVFESAAAEDVYLERLSATKLILTFSSSGSNGQAYVLSVSGTTITLGAESAVFLDGSKATYQAVYGLSETLVVVACRDNAAGDYGVAVAGSISGTTITWGTQVDLTGNAADHLAVIGMSATTALITFFDSNSTQTAVIATCSGTGNRTISLGTAVVFAGNGAYNALARMSATKAVACYKDNDNSSYPTACVLDVSGASITAGTPTVMTSIDAQYLSCAELNESNLISLFRQGGAGDYATIVVMGVSGTTITPRTKVADVMDGSEGHFSDLTKMTPTQALIAYRHIDDSEKGTARVMYYS